MPTIGLRAEDKSIWEARVPLVPDDIARLKAEHPTLEFLVQPSAQRAIPAADFEAAGARIAEDLSPCDIILGVKEIPIAKLAPHKAYMFFSHTIKAQPYNMPMLRHIVSSGATLLDYERIVDEQGRRLVFFGRYAGLAGMIDALWTLGGRLRARGVETPFAEVRRAYDYADLEEAKAHLRTLADELTHSPLPTGCSPLVFGFAGYGNVSQGAQEIFDLLPHRVVTPHELHALPDHRPAIYKCVFHEEHLVRRRDGGVFALQDYYSNPENYEGVFEQYADALSVLVNCIYWDARYPRLLSRDAFKRLWETHEPRLQVVADITCDVDGSLGCTQRATEPGDPVYVYNSDTGTLTPGLSGRGPAVLAVDILPCELPVDSSAAFSAALKPLVAGLAQARLDAELDQSGLPAPLQSAAIVWRGRLTAPYEYLADSAGV